MKRYSQIGTLINIGFLSFQTYLSLTCLNTYIMLTGAKPYSAPNKITLTWSLKTWYKYFFNGCFLLSFQPHHSEVDRVVRDMQEMLSFIKLETYWKGWPLSCRHVMPRWSISYAMHLSMWVLFPQIDPRNSEKVNVSLSESPQFFDCQNP